LSNMGSLVNPDEIADAPSGINMGGWLSNVRSGVIIGSCEVEFECFGVCYAQWELDCVRFTDVIPFFAIRLLAFRQQYSVYSNSNKV